MGCSDSSCDLSEYLVAVVGIIPIPPKRLSRRVAGDIQTGRKHYRNDPKVPPCVRVVYCYNILYLREKPIKLCRLCRFSFKVLIIKKVSGARFAENCAVSVPSIIEKRCFGVGKRMLRSGGK